MGFEKMQEEKSRMNDPGRQDPQNNNKPQEWEDTTL